MKQLPPQLQKRLSQILGELSNEGYIRVGCNGACVHGLRHPNGNRMTVIVTESEITYIKNGIVVKREPVNLAAVSAAFSKPASR